MLTNKILKSGTKKLTEVGVDFGNAILAHCSSDWLVMIEDLITHSHNAYSKGLPPPLPTSGGFAWGCIRFDSYRPWKLCGEWGEIFKEQMTSGKGTWVLPQGSVPASVTAVCETSTIEYSPVLKSWFTCLFMPCFCCVLIVGCARQAFPSARSVLAAFWGSLTPGWQ